MASPKNAAAFLDAEKAYPFVVREVPYPTPAPDRVIVRTHAIAINPADARMQYDAIFPTTYPLILGSDIAGEIVEVGDAVKHRKKGDRVMACAGGVFWAQPESCGFQKYVSVPPLLAVPIPDTMSYEKAAVMPCCFLTAAAAFYQKGYLNLQRPSLDPQPNGKTLFIWGGSGAVGMNTIQLAKAAGYEVITTASAKNFELCKALGADLVIDYNVPGVIDRIVAALKDKTVVGGVNTISEETLGSTVQVLEKAVGKSTVISVNRGTERYSTANVKVLCVGAFNFVNDEAAPAIVFEYWQPALAAHKLQAKPDPFVVGEGLESIQKAVDKVYAGVSAQKVVVSL